MPQIIEHGYLYIAQPPLFKVKKGKTEKYIQNEAEMQNMLFELAAEDIVVPLRGQEIKGKALIPFLKRLSSYEKLMDWYDRRRRDTAVLRVLLDEAGDKAFLKEQKAMAQLLEKIKKQVPDASIGEILVDEEHAGFRVEIRRRNHKLLIDANLFLSPEFREIEAFHGYMKEMGKPPYTITTKDGPKTMNTTAELYSFVFETARKGLSIQRYKGLGEMNPQQLWETTMDSEKRTLLQVSIEDSVQADEIFTILMGDQVEPRKDFIVKHALEARNIDI
jgi:DNA gyrase subunit B